MQAHTLLSQRQETIVVRYTLEDGRTGNAILPADADIQALGEKLGSNVAHAAVLWPKLNQSVEV